MKIVFWVTTFSFFLSHAQSVTVSLPQSLKYSNPSNPFLNTYFKNLELSDFEVAKAKVRSNPIFNMQLLALMDHSYYPQKPLIVSRTNRQDWFQLTKKIQPWGQRKNNINVAIHNYKLEKTQLSKTIYDNKYNTSIKWLNVWLSKINMELTQTAARSLDTLIERSAKDSASVVHLRYLILDDEYDMQYLDAQNDFQRAISELKIALGRLDPIDIDTTNFFYQNIPTLDSLIAYAIDQHPEILAQNQNLATDLASIKLQKSYTVPGPEIGVLYNPQNRIPYTGIFLTQPLPIFDQNKKNVAQAKVKLSQSQFEHQALLIEIQEDIKIKYHTYLAQIQKSNQMYIAEKNADRLLAMVRNAYAKKQPSEVDMWEAETTWFDVQKLYYEIEYERKKAYLDLLYASGKLE